ATTVHARGKRRGGRRSTSAQTGTPSIPNRRLSRPLSHALRLAVYTLRHRRSAWHPALTAPQREPWHHFRRLRAEESVRLPSLQRARDDHTHGQVEETAHDAGS